MCFVAPVPFCIYSQDLNYSVLPSWTPCWDTRTYPQTESSPISHTTPLKSGASMHNTHSHTPAPWTYHPLCSTTQRVGGPPPPSSLSSLNGWEAWMLAVSWTNETSPWWCHGGSVDAVAVAVAQCLCPCSKTGVTVATGPTFTSRGDGDGGQVSPKPLHTPARRSSGFQLQAFIA